MANSMGVSKVIEPFHIVATQLNTFTPVGTAISMVEYMKNNWPAAGMPMVNMWCAPDGERQDRDGCRGVHHRRIAEQRLAGKSGNDLRDDAECGQDQDVHLGVPEEPEDMLEHHRIAAAGRVEEMRTEMTVGQQHGHRTCQNRHDGDQQIGSDQPGPTNSGIFIIVMPGRAHVEDGGDDVDRAHDRRAPMMCTAKMVRS